MKSNLISTILLVLILLTGSLAWGSGDAQYKITEIKVGKNTAPQVQVLRASTEFAVGVANATFAQAARAMGCEKGDSSYKLTETKNSDGVLSFKVEYSSMCEGAAHPEDGIEGLSVDLKTGKKPTLNMLFKNFKKDQTAIAKKVFSNSDDEDCADFNADPADIGARLGGNSFYFSEGSITLLAQGPHSNRSCDLTGSVFISELSSFYANDSLLARIAKAHPEASCEGRYEEMKKKGELKKGLTFKQFAKLLCK